MLNSLFMLGSSFNKNRKVSLAFMIGWIVYVVINQLYLGWFAIVNAITFLVITVSINLVKNKKLNTMLSIFSILIWSITIDIICYYMYPLFTINQNIFEYIWQGIVFNYKYIFSNIIAVYSIYLLDLVIDKIVAFAKEKNYCLKKV